MSDRLARQWIAEHGAEYVTEKLAYMEGQGAVKSKVGYLTAAIRDDYKPAEKEIVLPPSDDAIKLAEERKAKVIKADIAQDQRRAERAERGRKFAIVADMVSSRNPTQRDADKRLFVASLEDELARDEFRAHGWNSALNASAIFAFWEDLEPGVFEEQASFKSDNFHPSFDCSTDTRLWL